MVLKGFSFMVFFFDNRDFMLYLKEGEVIPEEAGFF